MFYIFCLITTHCHSGCWGGRNETEISPVSLWQKLDKKVIYRKHRA